MKSNISLDVPSKIKALQSDLAKLEKDFDRAVDVTALKMTKKNGKIQCWSWRAYFNNTSLILQTIFDFLID